MQQSSPYPEPASSGFSRASQAARQPTLITGFARRVLKIVLLLPVFALAVLEFKLFSFSWDARRKALWLSKLCSKVLIILGVRIRVSGSPARKGLLVANHLSYLDILVIGTLHPTIFVAKSEVRHWPLFGFLASAAGCIFVDRQRRADVSRVGDALELPLGCGIPVCIFPEGTSSNGKAVLPFHPSLLEAAATGTHPVVPAGIDYFLAADDPGEKVCFWGEMELVPHLFGLMSQEWILASIRYGPSRQKREPRKTLAPRLREEVAALRVS